MTKYVWNPFTSNLDAQLTPFIEDFEEIAADQYVPYGQLVATGFKGVKGQWSYSENKYIACVATDHWIYLPSEQFVNEKFANILEQFLEQFRDQYVPYGELASSLFKGIKGQWSYNLDYFYLCVATDTWKAIGDINYVNAENLKTKIGAGLESDGSYLADETTNYIDQATSIVVTPCACRKANRLRDEIREESQKVNCEFPVVRIGITTETSLTLSPFFNASVVCSIAQCLVEILLNFFRLLAL